MTSENFVQWLSGFAELNESRPTERQWLVIKDHLSLVVNGPKPKSVTAPIKSETTPIIGVPFNPFGLNLEASGNGTPIQHRSC